LFTFGLPRRNLLLSSKFIVLSETLSLRDLKRNEETGKTERFEEICRRDEYKRKRTLMECAICIESSFHSVRH
jgi:hypothetical protein